MKRVIIPITMLLLGHTAFGMTGGPLFCVGHQVTSMTVEANRTNLQISSPNGDGDDESALSERVFLTARYGIARFVDLSASVGTANLGFTELAGGYTDFNASWSMAWGASVRAGFPIQPRSYQVVAMANYVGFQPKGGISNGMKDIDNKYLWHEIQPAVVLGVKVGPVVPYWGASKPFLFGKRDVKVEMRGEEFPSAGGSSNYSDAEQPVRGIFGVEWKLPEGYSITAEATSTTDGIWSMSVGLAQVLR